MKYILIVLFIVLALIIFKINRKEGFGFDFSGKYLWYKDPYSIRLWNEMYGKQQLWKQMGRRKYSNLNRHIYINN